MYKELPFPLHKAKTFRSFDLAAASTANTAFIWALQLIQKVVKFRQSFSSTPTLLGAQD